MILFMNQEKKTMTECYLDFNNVFEALCEQAAAHPDRRALIFLGDDGSELTVTYSELVETSRNYGESLSRSGLERGDIAMLLLPHSLEIVYAFFGGIHKGVVTSIYPYPAMNIESGKSCGMVKQALADIKARAVITTSDLAPEFSDSGCAVFEIKDNAPLKITEASPALEAVRMDPRIAYLQLTSGTTGSSKGVMLSHRNILSFLESSLNRQSWPFRFRVNWIPLYHTGALMGALISSLMSGMTLALMSPSKWIMNPLSFFQVIDRFRADKATLPNSGFVHALKYVSDRGLEKLDLSCLISLLSAGEPAGAEVINRFFDKFEKAGLDRNAFSNAYGQAEVTALISQSFTSGEIPVDRIDAELFYQSGIARGVDAGFPGSALSVVSCGRPVWGIEAVIEDEEGKSLPERRSGEVVVRGDVVFEGYHLAPELTAETLKNGWLHTGDVGYIAGGELYICDRKKDLIITGGKNVRPGDVEGIVYADFPECALCAAFGVYDDEIGTEKVVLVCEWTRRLDMRQQVEVEKKVRKLVYSGLSISLDEFQIVDPGWIVRTPTKKITRKGTVEKYSREF